MTNPESTAEQVVQPADVAESLIGTALDGQVAILTMKAAPYNLLDRDLCDALIDAFEWAKTKEVRAVVLNSSLRHFSAGADLEKMRDEVGENGLLDWNVLGLLRTIEQFPVPVVAGVHGACVGGGLELALACDLVIASASAKLGSVEASVGLHPLMGGIQRIAERAGSARAKEMTLLGRRYDAATLEQWGVINRVVPDDKLMSATMALAEELAHGPTVAHIATKQIAQIAASQGVAAADEAMAELERPIFLSNDFKTAVSRYLEKGPGNARFEGR